MCTAGRRRSPPLPEAATLTLVPRGRGAGRGGDERLAALLDALEAAVARRPVSEIGVAELASAAGISRSTFYFYFASKAAALGALVSRVREEMESGADFLRDTGDPPEVVVRQSIEQTAAVWRRHRHLMVAVVEAAGSDPDLGALWREWIEGFVPAIAARIEAERRAGRAPGGTDAVGLARALAWANERNLYMAMRERARPSEVTGAVDALSALWLGAIYGQAA